MLLFEGYDLLLLNGLCCANIAIVYALILHSMIIFAPSTSTYEIYEKPNPQDLRFYDELLHSSSHLPHPTPYSARYSHVLEHLVCSLDGLALTRYL